VALASKTSFGLAKPDGWGSWRGKAWAKDFGLEDLGIIYFMQGHLAIGLVA
jgi:hypothetical protein